MYQRNGSVEYGGMGVENVRIQSWNEFSDGGNLEEPVSASFLPVLWHLVGREVLCVLGK